MNEYQQEDHRNRLRTEIERLRATIDVGSALVELHAHGAFQRYRRALVTCRDAALRAMLTSTSSDLLQIGEQRGYARAMEWFATDTDSVKRKLALDEAHLLRLTEELGNIGKPLVTQLTDSFARPRSNQ